MTIENNLKVICNRIIFVYFSRYSNRFQRSLTTPIVTNMARFLCLHTMVVHCTNCSILLFKADAFLLKRVIVEALNRNGFKLIDLTRRFIPGVANCTTSTWAALIGIYQFKIEGTKFYLLINDWDLRNNVEI